MLISTKTFYHYNIIDSKSPHSTKNRKQITDNRQQTTDNRQQITDNRQQITDNRKQKTDNRQLPKNRFPKNPNVPTKTAVVIILQIQTQLVRKNNGVIMM